MAAMPALPLALLRLAVLGTALASNISETAQAEEEVRLLFVVHSGSPLSLMAMETTARSLEFYWAEQGTPRRVRAKLIDGGASVGEAALAIPAAIDDFEPCVLVGSTDPNAEVSHVAAHVAMQKNLLFVPISDLSSRTVYDSSSYDLTVNVQGISLGGAVFLRHFASFMRHFEWRRAVVLLDAGAARLSRELLEQVRGLDVTIQYVSLDVVDFELSLQRVLDLIRDGHYSIIGVSLPQSEDVSKLLTMAEARGLSGRGYQWLVTARAFEKESSWLPGVLYFVPSFYEFKEADPERRPSGALDPLFRTAMHFWMKGGSTSGLPQYSERLICGSSPCQIVGRVGLDFGYYEALVISSALLENAALIASSLKDRGLCGSRLQREQAGHGQLLQAVLDKEIQSIFSEGPMEFSPVPGGLSWNASVFVATAEDYGSWDQFDSYIDSLGFPGPSSLLKLLLRGFRRCVAVIGRNGRVSLMDGYLNIPGSRLEEVFGQPFLFMGGSTEVPRDYIPDSCGPKAVVNGSACIACGYGFALPMNGTNKCLLAAEECASGSAWSFELRRCEECAAGTLEVEASCQACPVGRTSTAGKAMCELCSEGYHMSRSSDECLFCTGGGTTSFMPYRATFDDCIFDFQYVPWISCSLALTLLFAQLLSQLSLNLGCRIRGRLCHIDDITLERGQVVVTTLGPHGFTARCRKAFELSFQNAGHPVLNDRGRRFFGEILSVERIGLCEESGAPLTRQLDASQGTFHLSALDTLNYTGTWLPVMLQLWLWLLVAVAAGTFVSTFERLVSLGVGILAGVLLSNKRKRKRAATTLEGMLRRYSRFLAKRPQAVPRGPDRALGAGQISELYSHFQGIIKQRDLYFVASNIVRHLTRPSELSLAEVLGPKRVQWFVSHWWGEKFSFTVSSILQHAQHPDVSGKTDWRDVAYWLCTFSNNQYHIEEELGRGCTGSSFYLALRSGGCRGTCMILGEKAEPLRRSWCLFEFIQTMQLEESMEFPNFEGLFFCTSTGVLNYGRASMEISLQMGSLLAGLKLQDAMATVHEDKVMIDRIVEKEMGGFELMNAKLRSHMAKALKTAKASSDADFNTVFHALGPAEESESRSNVIGL